VKFNKFILKFEKVRKSSRSTSNPNCCHQTTFVVCLLSRFSLKRYNQKIEKISQTVTGWRTGWISRQLCGCHSRGTRSAIIKSPASQAQLIGSANYKLDDRQTGIHRSLFCLARPHGKNDKHEADTESERAGRK